MKKNLIGISGYLWSGKDEVGIVLQYLNCLKLNTLAEHQKDYNNFRLLQVSNELQSGYQIKKFDNKRKDIVCLLLGCTRKQLEKDLDKELGEEWWYFKRYDDIHITPYKDFDSRVDDGSDFKHKLVKLTPRKLSQLLDTEAGRNIIHPNIWINALFVDYKDKYIGDWGMGHHMYEKPNWIITDVRFENEAQAIKDRGGIVIRVNRDKYFDCTCVTHEEDVKNCFHCDGTGRHLDTPDNEHYSETALDDYEFDAVLNNEGSIEELVEKVKQLKLV